MSSSACVIIFSGSSSFLAMLFKCDFWGYGFLREKGLDVLEEVS